MAVLWRLFNGGATLNRGIFEVERVLPGGVLLTPLLVPRIPGTPSHRHIQKYISNYFLELGWHFEVDRFRQATVTGPMTFTNLIATSDPSADKRIILAAHYDSKGFIMDGETKRFDFVGATDSAWSCALLMELARSVPVAGNTSIQMIFFDGEEALEEWSEHDSIYGSKHLAKIWSNARQSHRNLQNIKYFILLDLLGAVDTKLYSFFPKTYHLFKMMADIEEELRVRGKLQTTAQIFISQKYVQGFQNGKFILGDDHVPFAELGVPIIHLIPAQFPNVWHTPRDDITALDQATCHDIALILYNFLQIANN